MSSTTALCVHDNLVDALALLRRAEHSAVTLFARVLREELFQLLGHATIELYGTEGLGLSLSKTRQFIRLARALEKLPATSEALDAGDLDWTKARTITSVATPRTEERWIATAAATTSRELESKVRKAKARNKRERERLRCHRGQAALVLDGPIDSEPDPPIETPVSLSLTFSPVEHARYEMLYEQLRKRGRTQSLVDLFIEGLAAMAEAGETRELSVVPYHIVAYRCDTCNRTTVNGRPIAFATAEAMNCDAIQISADNRVPNRSVIPPSIRRAVLARDGHRCTSTGCGATRFLEVHHTISRSSGGKNTMENLTTLCGPCHRYIHAKDRTWSGRADHEGLPCIDHE